MKRQMSRERWGSYLLTDGTLVECFSEKINGNTIGDSADITFNYCKQVSIRPRYRTVYNDQHVGRIVLSRYDNGFTKLAKGGKVSAHLPDTEGGSENTKDRNLAVQHVTLTTKTGEELSWCEIPSLISGSFTPQIGSEYALPEVVEVGSRFWSGITVNKITGTRPVVESTSI